MKVSLFPVDEETLVVTHEWDAIISRIEDEVSKPALIGTNPLTGWVKEDEFQLALRIRRVQFFMPLVNGKIDPTSKGSLVFLRYTMFPATRFFLLFWSIVLPLIGLAMSLTSGNWLYFPGFLLMVAFIYAVAWSNFKLHLGTTRRLLYQLLN